MNDESTSALRDLSAFLSVRQGHHSKEDTGSLITGFHWTYYAQSSPFSYVPNNDIRETNHVQPKVLSFHL